MLSSVHSRHLQSTRGDAASKSIGSASTKAPSRGMGAIQEGAAEMGGPTHSGGGVGGRKTSYDGSGSASDISPLGSGSVVAAGLDGVQGWLPSGEYVPGCHPWLQLLGVSGVLIEGETALWRRMLPTESAEDTGGAAAALEVRGG